MGQPNNNKNKNESWNIKLIPKSKCYDNEKQTESHIVFGVCDSSLLDSGYKHKFYGYGYSVTYCHGFKFYSFVTSFKIGSEITIKYNKHKRQISFWCDGIMKQRTINIALHPLSQYAVTMTSYNDNYAIEIL